MDRYRALLIGNSNFPADTQNLQDLRGPAKDVAALRSALTDGEVGLFDGDHVALLADGSAAEIMEEIETFFADARRDDQLLLFYSGHGLLDERNQLYLAAANTRIDRLRSTAVGAAEISEMLRSSAARTAVILLDCCHSGAFKGSIGPANLAGSGRFVLTSCRGGELANDADRENGTSLFTQHLVDGLMGGARDLDGDGQVDADDIYRYIHDRLSESNRQIPQRRFDGSVRTPPLARRSLPSVVVSPSSPLAANGLVGTPTEAERNRGVPAEPVTVGGHPRSPANLLHGFSPRRRVVAGAIALVLVSLFVATVAGGLLSSESSNGMLAPGPGKLQNPQGVALAANGDLLIADTEKNRIMRVPAGGGEVSRVAGTEVNRSFVDGGVLATETRVKAPRIVVSLPDSGYVVANDSEGLLVVGADKTLRRVAGQERLGAGTISAVAATADGLLYVAMHTEIFTLDMKTGEVTPFAGRVGQIASVPADGSAAATAAFGSVRGLGLDATGSHLYVVDFELEWLGKIDLKTKQMVTVSGLPNAPYEEGGLASLVGLKRPSALAVGPDGSIYFTESGQYLRRVVNERITTVAGPIKEGLSNKRRENFEDGRPATNTKFISLAGVAVDAQNGVYVSDGLNRIRYIDSATGLVSTRA